MRSEFKNQVFPTFQVQISTSKPKSKIFFHYDIRKPPKWNSQNNKGTSSSVIIEIINRDVPKMVDEYCLIMFLGDQDE